MDVPPEAGFPIGPSTRATYAVLQYVRILKIAFFFFGNTDGEMFALCHFQHYDNPTVAPDFVDSSGITLVMKERDNDVREDAAFLFLGMSNGNIAIPPQSAAWHYESECATPLASLPIGNEVHLFAVGVHMHKV